MRDVTLRKTGKKHVYNVLFNTFPIGDMEPNDDGTYVIWMYDEGPQGYLSAHFFLTIGEMLDAINRPWLDHLDKYFSGKKVVFELESVDRQTQEIIKKYLEETDDQCY